ncbi:MAG: MotA/TolQ/ExbB proton channel family protein [Marinobacter sp.]|uniref:MotA/TolQ/ExbB proton channel family protein n=1 Tax=Marinobacter sp. TaxID=50741 RepID=UPI00299E574E|nr:MotA/TolQ/ExbB proton channel family protein [Marinobacter sp.]MDX1756260.1 MotA/TolQ/ExbB proton channel family protein [Marinobacter sp.]
MGGPVIVVLLALAVAGLITFFYLLLAGVVYAPRRTRQLRQALDQWQQHPDSDCLDRLRTNTSWFGRANPLRSLIIDTMRARLAKQDPATLKETLARDARAALEPFEAPLKIIEVIAALAPLLGLLGTVLGMMDAFGAMATTEGRANASQLSGGIYEALTTTAAGLIVAIPFAALAAWIEFRLRRLNTMVNATLVTLMAPAIGAARRQPAANPGPDRVSDPHEPSFERATTRLAHAAG